MGISDQGSVKSDSVITNMREEQRMTKERFTDAVKEDIRVEGASEDTYDSLSWRGVVCCGGRDGSNHKRLIIIIIHSFNETFHVSIKRFDFK